MPRVRVLRSLLASIAVCLFVLSGCGGGKKGVIVKGKLVLPANVKLIDTDNVKITLSPEGNISEGYGGVVSNSDNSFTLTGVAKKGVPPGKYKVSVQLKPYPGSEEAKQRSTLFANLNQTYSTAKSKLTCEITADPEQSITIDLVKGTVTKN